METFEHPGRFGLGLALETLGHHGSGTGRDGAPGALKGDVAHHAVLQAHEHAHLVAAERIEAVRTPVLASSGLRQLRGLF